MAKLTEGQEKLAKQLVRASEIVIEFAAPDLPQSYGNMTPEGLVDITAELGIAKRKIEAAEKTMKEMLKAKLGSQRQCRGEKYSYELGTSYREALDQTKAKQVLSELGRLEECMGGGDVDRVNFKEL